MKVLVVTQYFWPENFRVNDLVTELVNRCHEVTVLTGLPNYPDGKIFEAYRADPKAYDSYAGADIVRVSLLPRGTGGAGLVLNYLSFLLSASIAGPFKLRGRRVDAIFVFEPSPITVGVPAIVMKWLKRAPIVFWVLDLWPQSLEAVGAVRSPFVLGLVDRLVRFVYRHSDRILAQSKSFIPAIARQVDDAGRIAYFPGWAEPVPRLADVAPADEIPAADGMFSIVFTGNVGEAQDFGAVLDAAEILRDERVRWIVVGDGRRSDWLSEEVARRGLEESVRLPGRFPLERMPSFWRHADALLVSLRDEPIFALTIPGKVQSYLSTGLPILAMLNGEGAQVITDAGAGLAVGAGDSKALAFAVRTLMQKPATELLKLGASGRAYADREFNRSTLITRLESELSEAAAAYAE